MDIEIENKTEELLTAVNVEELITKLSVNVQTTLIMLKEFCEREGSRTIKELDQMMHSTLKATELNAFLRLVYNNEHPTVGSEGKEVRSADYDFEKDKLTGQRIIKASKKGLSFCRNVTQFIKAAKAKASFAVRAKRSEDQIRIYLIDEDSQLPVGLEFYKDSPGHVSLIATHDMSWNELVHKLKMVCNYTLKYYTTIRINYESNE